MDLLYEKAAGIDVHSKMVTACVRHLDGRHVSKETRTFGTMTGDIQELAAWLQQNAVVYVAMESTGVYWKPLWNILEDRFELVLVNPAHFRNVPGRKTDVADCEWLAELLQYGLLRGSFVPERRLRDLRDLTRTRTSLLHERSRMVQRIQKVLEDANIKLTEVIADITGVSGLEMLNALVEGVETPEEMARRARGRMKQKIELLTKALNGRVTDHHRHLLRLFLHRVNAVDGDILVLDRHIADEIEHTETKGIAYEQACELLSTIPGINRRAAENLVAEIGTDMSRFPTPAHLASWAKVCPGNNRSADVSKKSSRRRGNAWLRGALCQAATSAVKTKGSYFLAQHRRLAARRGSGRAIMAVAHSMLTAIWHILKDATPYVELGEDWFDRRDRDRTRDYLIKRLERLGYEVAVT